MDAEAVANQLVCDWLSEVNGTVFTPQNLGQSAKKHVEEIVSALTTFAAKQVAQAQQQGCCDYDQGYQEGHRRGWRETWEAALEIHWNSCPNCDVRAERYCGEGQLYHRELTRRHAHGGPDVDS